MSDRSEQTGIYADRTDVRPPYLGEGGRIYWAELANAVAEDAVQKLTDLPLAFKALILAAFFGGPVLANEMLPDEKNTPVAEITEGTTTVPVESNG